MRKPGVNAQLLRLKQMKSNDMNHRGKHRCTENYPDQLNHPDQLNPARVRDPISLATENADRKLREDVKVL